MQRARQGKAVTRRREHESAREGPVGGARERLTATGAGARERMTATGADLRAAFLAASGWLDQQAERVNGLNVFPVPDGDTGTNMSLTLRAAVDALRRLPDTAGVGEVARAAYDAAMLGARGNSGVILSQLLRGFAAALEGAGEVEPTRLAEAFAEASVVAYRGVGRPVEGTILTVSRLAGEAARAAARAGADLPGLLERTVRAAGQAVAETPSHLEVLRKAGVVDAGGEGYRVILEGALMWSTGHSIELAAAGDASSEAHGGAFQAAEDGEDEPFGFCTEFLLRESDLPLPEVRAAMEALGDSVIAVGDGDLLRVHVHTPRPGRALEFAVDHGTVAKVKVENMQLQHRERVAAQGAAGHGPPSPGPAPTAPPGSAAVAAPTPPATDGEAGAATGTIAVVAVAAGEGLGDVFRSLGAAVVEGGQTMNPSVRNLLDAVRRSGRREVILLPNNRNVLLSARGAADLADDVRVEVVPTETVPQGIGALLAFNFQADLASNVSAMQRAAGAVHTVEVTRAVRDAQVDGVSVRAGDVLGIYDGAVVATGESHEAALLGALAKAPVQALEVVTLYHGDGASADEARGIADRVRALRGGLEVEVVAGGQPHYPYVVSLE